MVRYTKFTSNYIRRGKHQTLKDGSTIFERNWVTLGNQLHFGPGKIPYYTSGNFVFTTSPVSTYKKKYRLGTTVSTWTYDDVKDAVSNVNNIEINEVVNDLRSFAYYGSCLELVRTSIENIIKEFPGNLTLTNIQLDYEDEESESGFNVLPGYIVQNQFKIDLHHDNLILEQYDNKYRYMSYSFKEYVINGKSIDKYSIETDFDYDCPKNDQWNIKKAPVVVITITDSDNAEYVLKGYKVDDEIIYLYDGDELVIQPNEEVIEEYFANIDGFEKVLLTRKSRPLYTNRFKTPIEGELKYFYFERAYTWPSNGYCIDITSDRYLSFVQKLSDAAENYDSMWTDNIYRRMTHEAITNYDWTYTRSWHEGEEEENIEGGERMTDILHIIGRVFDEPKRYIDNIKNNNKITFNGKNNCPSALISDKLELHGWDVSSTVPMFFGESEEGLDVLSIHLDNDWPWYNTLNPTMVTPLSVDVDFMRRLFLMSKRIFSTKGTIHGIEMIMAMFGYGDEDFTITEKYRTVEPKDYDYSESSWDGETLGDRIIRINSLKNNVIDYDDDVSGIPVGSFVYKGKTYLIPYYDQKKFYDNDLYFQSNGYWPEETLSYLNVAKNIQELLNVNARTIEKGDIYYVFNLSDSILFDETAEPKSHFFVVVDEYTPENYSSWENLDMEDGAYEGYGDEDRKFFETAVENAKYLSQIISTNIGNNPHVGYGKYDKGEDFFEYMKKPFKYAIDTFSLPYEEREQATKINFDVSDPKNGEKIAFLKDEDINPENENYQGYNLNTKVVVMENKIENNYYKMYFKNVILPYLLQMIPSTTIFMLENFEIIEN